MPVCAVSGDQVDVLADVLTGYLPPSPQLYPDDMLTDEPEQVLVAELIREAALEGVRDELPHSIAVVVEEMIPTRASSLKIYADIYVERPSQKAIVIGARRQPAARRSAPRPGSEIEELLGTPGLPRPARTRRQGLAARPEAAAQAGLLIHAPVRPGRPVGLGATMITVGRRH